MIFNFNDFKKYNSYYGRKGCKELVIKMYSGKCQVCGQSILKLSDMWIGHRTPRSHENYFQSMVEDQIDIDNLLNLQPEHDVCNLRKSNFYVKSATLFQSAMDQAAREINSLASMRPYLGVLGVELIFDLSGALRDGPDRDHLWLDLGAVDDLVQEEFKVSVSSVYQGAYLSIWSISKVLINSSAKEAACFEIGGCYSWGGDKKGDLYKSTYAFWERGEDSWRRSGKSVGAGDRRNGWAVFPKCTDLENFRSRVYSPEHLAALNLQKFSDWIDSGYPSKSGLRLCKGSYIEFWSRLYNRFHDIANDLPPWLSCEVGSGNFKNSRRGIRIAHGDAPYDVIERLLREASISGKYVVDDGFYELFDNKKALAFIRRSRRIVKALVNSTSSMAGRFEAGYRSLI